MEQRDLIKDQIDQLGKVLAKMMSDFLRLKAKGQISDGIEAFNEDLKGQLDIDLDKLTTLTRSELKADLQLSMLTAEQLEILSEYLKEKAIAELQTNYDQAILGLSRAIELLVIADEFSSTLSYERLNSKKEIERLLRQNKSEF